MIGTITAQEDTGIAGALNGRGEHPRCGLSCCAVRDKLNAEKETLTPDVAYHFVVSTKFPNNVQLKQWGPFIFVSLDPLVSFDDWIGPVREQLNWLDLNLYKFDASLSQDYLVSANWRCIATII